MKKLFVSTLLLAAATNYHLLQTLPLPGDGSWDYLTFDSEAQRLYVSHGTQVHVLDAAAGKLIDTIADTPGVHGIALAQEFGRGFISNGATNNVSLFDLKTLKVLSKVPAGKKPDAIIYDPASKRVIVNNNGGNSTTVLDAKTAKPTGTIELGGAPEFAAADGKGMVYLNLEDTNELVKIDPVALKVAARWPLKPCETPTGLAMDQSTHRLFVACRSKVMAVVDADSGKVITTMPIGAGTDAAVFDPKTKLVYCSNGDGTINVFHQDSADKYSAVETVKTEAGAKTMALDPKTSRIFTAAAQREGRAVKPGTFAVLVYGK